MKPTVYSVSRVSWNQRGITFATMIVTIFVCALFLTACGTTTPAAPTPAATPIVLAATSTPTSLPPTPTLTPISQAETAAVEPMTETTTLSGETSVTGTQPLSVAAPLTPDSEIPIVPLTETVALSQTEPELPAIEEPLQAIVVGVNAEFDPFEYRDEAGQLVGFDIDLINALAQVTSIEVSFVDMDFNELIPAVVNGEIDGAISAITRTDERAELVAFTDPYFTTDQSPVSFFSGGQGLAVRTDTTNIQSAADLTETIKVGVKSGTTGDFFVVENSTAQIVRFDESPEALTALANGDVDAVVTDIAVIAEFVTDHPELNVQLMGQPLTVEAYAIVVNKERPDLLQILNAGLTRIREDGTYDQIFEKWFELP